MDAEVLWRLLNFWMSLTSLIVLAIHTYRVRERLDMYKGLLMLALVWYLVSHTVGSIENIQQGNPVGYRTVFATAAAFTATFAAFIGPRATEPQWVSRLFDRYYDRKERKS